MRRLRTVNRRRRIKSRLYPDFILDTWKCEVESIDDKYVYLLPTLQYRDEITSLVKLEMKRSWFKRFKVFVGRKLTVMVWSRGKIEIYLTPDPVPMTFVERVSPNYKKMTDMWLDGLKNE